MAEGTLEGKVVGISDGDTITVLTEKKEQVKVRLARIIHENTYADQGLGSCPIG